MKTVCIILVAFLISICVIVFNNKILIDKMGIDNSIVRLINGKVKDFPYTKQNINWQALYPFQKIETKEENKIIAYTTKVANTKEKIMNYSSKNLFFYQEIVETAKKYEQIIGKLQNFNDSDKPFEIEDNYFVRLAPEVDVTSRVEATVELAEFCKNINIDFLFVQPPTRIDLNKDIQYLNLDHSNRNVDKYLAGLNADKIDILDIREAVKKENINVHDLYFGTDHHWKPEAGLWATKLIAKRLNHDYNFNIDLSLFDINKYDKKLYKGLFLGAFGRIVTLVEADLEDISLFYPKFKTNVNIKVPSIAVDKTGDFSVTYDMSAINTTDFYNYSIYSAYNYNEKAIIKIHNN